jgi:gamma-D-glutamyl-L-lysine dipeptidyl-peptidase
MTNLDAEATAIIAEVRTDFAPDPRLEVFDVTAEYREGVLSLEGVVSEPDALDELHRRLALIGDGTKVVDRVDRLPERVDEGRAHALVMAAIAPMLSTPAMASVQVSQVVLGRHLIVLRQAGRWLQCRGADGYLGWIHHGYLHRTDEAGARAWEMGAAGTPHLSLGALLFADDGTVLTRLPWGAKLALDAGWGVLPNGLRGRVEGDVLPLIELPARFPANGLAVVATAMDWLGAPYLWGGVTPAGVDCSGLVQAVLRVHGREMPRDADLQARQGEPLQTGHDFEALRAGDLLFFAEYSERISHVALSMGGAKIIHSAVTNGGVRCDDLTGDDPLQRDLREHFVCARRVLASAG